MAERTITTDAPVLPDDPTDPVTAALQGLPWTPSTPGQVGAFYDENDAVLEQIQGGVMHYGYWTGPEDRSDFETAAVRLTDLMIDRLGVGPGDRVLDLGCGTGGPAVRIAERTGADVVGLSISRNDVLLGRKRATAAGLPDDRVSFVHGDATVMPFPDEHFDAVHALESIVHIPDRVGVLRQVARVLRPGGRFALTDFVQHAIPSDDEDIAGLLASMAAWRSSPPVARDAYGRFAPAAGLVVDEDLDITEHTKYTIVHTYAGLDAWVDQHGPLPAGLAAIHALGAGVDFAAFTEAPQEDGVVLVSGHRPTDA